MTMGKDNINNYVKIIGNVFADLNIWNGISARTQFGINYGNSYSRTVDGAYVETGFRGNDKNYVRNNQSHPLNYVWTNTCPIIKVLENTILMLYLVVSLPVMYKKVFMQVEKDFIWKIVILPVLVLLPVMKLM